VPYLIRHGHTALNAVDEVHGRFDDPLDTAGHREAEALGEFFTGVPLEAVYASPLQRARQTATPVAATAGLEVVVDPLLMDRDYGPWTGKPKADVIAKFGRVDDAPGIELWRTFADRAAEAFLTLAHRHGNAPVAIVAHDAINQAVIWQLFPGRWKEHTNIPQRNGCWNRLDLMDNGQWDLVVLDALPGDGTRP
jgi:broad specificity phosphatase PhoE